MIIRIPLTNNCEWSVEPGSVIVINEKTYAPVCIANKGLHETDLLYYLHKGDEEDLRMHSVDWEQVLGERIRIQAHRLTEEEKIARRREYQRTYYHAKKGK